MMHRFATVCAIFAVLTLVTADLAAQQGQGQGQRQGRRQGFGGRQGSLVGLLMVEEVRQEVKLTEAQQAEVREAMQAMRRAGGQGQRGRGNFQDMSEEERAEARARMRQQAQQRFKASKEALAKVLSADQMKRLTEIYIQRQGVRALSNDDVAATLKLTEQQKSKIAELTSAPGGANRQGRGAGQDQAARRAARQEMQQRREQLNKDVMAVLTTDQQAAFKKLQGEPFEMPARGGAGAGGGRGAGRGAGAGGPDRGAGGGRGAGGAGGGRRGN